MTQDKKMTVSSKVLWFWGISLALFVAGLFLLNPILLPFVMGIVFAYLLNPLVDKLSKARFSRAVSAGLILFAFFGILGGIVFLLYPFIQAQVLDFIRWIPQAALRTQAYFNETIVPFLQDYLGEDQFPGLFETSSSYIGSTFTVMSKILREIFMGGVALFNLLTFIFITPIISFYLLREWPVIVNSFDHFIPRKHLKTVRGLLKDIDHILSGFMRGQFIVCITLALYFGAALTLVGLKFGLIVGLVSGLLAFIPFVGFLVGFISSIAIAFFQFDTIMPFMLIILVFVVDQIAENYYLYPQFVGKRVKLHPVWLIFALFAFAYLFGFMGALIAIPMAAVIGVLVRFFLDKYLQSSFYLK